MEIFQTIWAILTTPNLDLCNLIISPFIIIEILVGMLFFTTLLNFNATKKQKIIYVIVLSIWSNVCSIFIPKPYGLYLNIVVWTLLVFFIFKTTILKSIMSILLLILSSAILETIISKIYYTIFSISYELTVSIPIYRISIMLLTYLGIYLIYLLAKRFNWHLTFKNIRITKNSSRRLFIINFILGIITVGAQAYLIVFYTENLPFPIVILNSITLVTYFIISIYSLLKASKLEITTQSLEETKLYNKTLELLYDNMKAFKHDFSNIMQALAGYVDAGDMEGLRKYFKDLNRDCIEANNLSALSPKVINNPAIYSILASKYYKADKYDIKINLEIFLDLNTLGMKTYQFTRILGILLDNAIEATLECEEKIINLTIRNDFKVKRQLLIIENTYNNKDIDTEKIFEKGYSTKPKNTGVGLWEVRQILAKNKNLNLFTSKDDTYFKQQLEIY